MARSPDSNCVEFTITKVTHNSIEFTFEDVLNGFTNDYFGLFLHEGDVSSECNRSSSINEGANIISYTYDTTKITGLKPDTQYTLCADAWPVTYNDAFGCIVFTTNPKPKLVDTAGLKQVYDKIMEKIPAELEESIDNKIAAALLNLENAMGEKNLILNPFVCIDTSKMNIQTSTNTVNGESFTRQSYVSVSNIDLSSVFDWNNLNELTIPTTFCIGLKGCYDYSNTPDFSGTSYYENLMSLSFQTVRRRNSTWILTTNPITVSNILSWQAGATNYDRTGNMALKFTFTIDVNNQTATIRVDDYFNSSNVSTGSSKNWIHMTLYKIVY